MRIREWLYIVFGGIGEIDSIVGKTTQCPSCAGMEAENKRLRFDLSKPPQEREYCAGCSLPSENKRLREAVECLREMPNKLGPHYSIWLQKRKEVLAELHSRAGVDK